MAAERRSPGSYTWDQVTHKGPLRGCLRIRGAVIWSCPHEHHSTATARDCARSYLIAHPEVGRPVVVKTKADLLVELRDLLLTLGGEPGFSMGLFDSKGAIAQGEGDDTHWEVSPYNRKALGYTGEGSHRGRLVAMVGSTETEALQATIDQIKEAHGR